MTITDNVRQSASSEKSEHWADPSHCWLELMQGSPREQWNSVSSSHVSKVHISNLLLLYSTISLQPSNFRGELLKMGRYINPASFWL